jgi:hypothetical protein
MDEVNLTYLFANKLLLPAEMRVICCILLLVWLSWLQLFGGQAAYNAHQRSVCTSHVSTSPLHFLDSWNNFACCTLFCWVDKLAWTALRPSQ